LDDGAASVRLRLDLAYDGAGFRGWSAQPEQRSVQGEVEAALARILRLDPSPSLTVAGRTDAGVHAAAQVAHADVPAEAWAAVEPGARLNRSVNAVLPPDIRVYELRAALPGFDARFSALARRYCYRIADRPRAQDPLTRGRVLWHPRPLDADRMAAAAAGLVGEHDFIALCRPRPGGSTVRTVLAAEVARQPDSLLELRIEADAFCRSMVRSIAGALVAIGEGRREVEWIGQILAQDHRAGEATVMPAHGLTLEAVRYPPAAELASAAIAHRRVRGPLH
jgi:tRNA pseudouridine38-40 synthase